MRANSLSSSFSSILQSTLNLLCSQYALSHTPSPPPHLPPFLPVQLQSPFWRKESVELCQLKTAGSRCSIKRIFPVQLCSGSQASVTDFSGVRQTGRLSLPVNVVEIARLATLGALRGWPQEEGLATPGALRGWLDWGH